MKNKKSDDNKENNKTRHWTLSWTFIWPVIRQSGIRIMPRCSVWMYAGFQRKREEIDELKGGLLPCME